MADEPEEDVARSLRAVLDRPPASTWSVTAESIRTRARPRWLAAVPPTSVLVVAVAAAAVLIAVLVYPATGDPHTSRVASGSPAAPVPRHRGTGPTTSSPTGRAGTFSPGSPTSTVPGTPTVQPGGPAVSVTPAICPPGPQALTQDAPDATTCLAVGATLTVTFVAAGEFGGRSGGWIGPPTSADPAIASIEADNVDGTSRTVRIRAAAVGATTVTVFYSNVCAPGGSTPCTIPPQGSETLTVQVAPS